MKKKSPNVENGRVYLDINGHVANMVLDRPKKHNALTPQMYREIGECCEEANRNEQIHVVIISGAGERAFCAGSDINTLKEYEDFWAWRNRADYIPPILSIRKPTIAAIKGWALGGGLEIALACDLRIASRTAQFSAPEVTLGWNGAGGAAQHLTRLCGYGQAMKILLTGERFSAEEAKKIGAIEWLVDEGEELTKAKEIAQAIASHKSHATQTVKAAVRFALDGTVAQGLAYENELMSLCFAKKEATERQ